MRTRVMDRINGAKGTWFAPALAAGLSLALGLVLSRRWHLGPVDDAYISLRYAANWASGRGLCFNPGERVEGYTNFLLVLLQTIGIRLGCDPEIALRAIGWIAFGSLAAVVARMCAAGPSGDRKWFAVASGVVITLNPALLCWALSGMETVLYALLVLASILFVSGDRHPPRPTAAGISLVLAGLTRPEAIALFPFLAALIYLNGGTRRGVLRFAILFVVAFGAYFTVRAFWFGSLFPNTFYAKLDYGNSLLLKRGLGYVWSFIVASPLLVLSAAAAVPLLRGAPHAIKGCAIVAAVHLLTVIYEGGDHFTLFRFVVPVLPALGLLALHPWDLLASRPRWIGRRRYAPRVLGLLVLAISSFTMGRFHPGGHKASALEIFRIETSYPRHWAEVGRYLRRAAPRDASLATVAIGAIGYHSDLRIVDPLGLVNPAIARKKTPLGRGKPGHEKFDVDEVLSRRPSYILIVNLPKPEATTENQEFRFAWGPYNALLIQDPRLREAYRFESIHLEDGWWGIHVRNEMPPLGVPSQTRETG